MRRHGCNLNGSIIELDVDQYLRGSFQSVSQIPSVGLNADFLVPRRASTFLRGLNVNNSSLPPKVSQSSILSQWPHRRNYDLSTAHFCESSHQDRSPKSRARLFKQESGIQLPPTQRHRSSRQTSFYNMSRRRECMRRFWRDTILE